MIINIFLMADCSIPTQVATAPLYASNAIPLYYNQNLSKVKQIMNFGQ